MIVFNAEVADILRSSQRDETFINELNSQIHSILKLCGTNSYNKYYKYVETVTNIWYYSLTSLSNLQTLGEEYAGILRVNNDNKLVSSWVIFFFIALAIMLIPNFQLQILWLTVHIGGGALYDRFLKKIRKELTQSESLTETAKGSLLQITELLHEKDTLIRLHHSLFYIFGKYYHLSNRLTGIKYVSLFFYGFTFFLI